MEKGTFYKKIKDNKNGYTFEKTEGYIDHGKRIAYAKAHGIYEKNKMFWTATDTQTGLYITTAHRTRKECIAEVEKNMEAIEKVRNDARYNKCVCELQDWIKEQPDFKAEVEQKTKERMAELKAEQEGEKEMKQTKKRARGQEVGVCEHSEVVEWKNVVKVKDRASIKRLEKKEKAAHWERNEEHKGIEISFKERPNKAVREMLKSAGFRWHNKKQTWYAKETDARVEIANMVCA